MSSLQARHSKHQALNFRRQILTFAALSSLSDSFGGLLSAIFTSAKFVWQPGVVESIHLNYHLQNPSLKEAGPREVTKTPDTKLRSNTQCHVGKEHTLLYYATQSVLRGLTYADQGPGRTLTSICINYSCSSF